MPDDAPVTTATDPADGGGSAMSLTLVQTDAPIELNRRTPEGRGLRRSASAPGGRPNQPGHHTFSTGSKLEIPPGEDDVLAA